jgi:starvation-inducible DNA-binding protein
LITEHVLTLEGIPLQTFEDYIKYNQLEIGNNIHQVEQAIELIVLSLFTLLTIELVILKKSAEIDDEGTNSMMGNFISEQEKTIWMLKAWHQE